MKRTLRLLLCVLSCLAFEPIARAHVGSPDIYLDAKAGPYQLFITVRTPTVIPGVAQIEVRSGSPGVQQIQIVPLALTGAGARYAPTPDTLSVSKQDPQFFTGSFWLMVSGSSQVRITVDGAQGKSVIAVPVPSFAVSTKKMPASMGLMLTGLMSFLVFGVVAMAGASAREGDLLPGMTPGPDRLQRGRKVMVIAGAIVATWLFLGWRWWQSSDADYRGYIYKPLTMSASVEPGNLLSLNLSDPGWLRTRVIDDLVPDHGHLMHLYLIRQPGYDAVYHLHPDLVGTGRFELSLPSVEAGRYNLYADIVHENGFPETLTSFLSVPTIHGRPLKGDDAAGYTKAISQGLLSPEFVLPDGYRMQWIRLGKSLRAREGEMFKFRLLDREGCAPSDMELYMGMLGHAAFVKDDGTVFAHIHPTGTVSMTAFMMAQSGLGANGAMPGMNHSGMQINAPAIASYPNEVRFPYGFPTAGRYRIIVQMRHSETVETGFFDTDVQ